MLLVWPTEVESNTRNLTARAKLTVLPMSIDPVARARSGNHEGRIAPCIPGAAPAAIQAFEVVPRERAVHRQRARIAAQNRIAVQQLAFGLGVLPQASECCTAHRLRQCGL